MTYRSDETISGTGNGAEVEDTIKEQKVVSKLRLKSGKAPRISLMRGAHSEFLLEVTAEK